MENLLAELLRKAEGAGGEAWLRRCLQEPVPTVAEARPEEEEAGPSRRVICRILPPRDPAEQEADAPAERHHRSRNRHGERPEKRRRSSSKRTGSAPVPPPPPEESRARGDRRHGSSSSRRRHRSPAHRDESSQQPSSDSHTPQHGGAAESAAVGGKKQVWILGHSFVVWAAKRAEQRTYGANLSFNRDEFEIQWFGYSGLRWRDLYCILQNLAAALPPPDILIIHAGGNDIGKVKTLDLLCEIKRDLSLFKCIFPKCILIFSEIIPRLAWIKRGLYFHEKIRKRINYAVSRFITSLGGLSFRHLELEGYVPGFYWSDSVHLSCIGSDILNAHFQSMVDLGAVARLEGGPGQ
ncbi:uncharacterized protein [Dendropsophus ebraccatus]|uniref:uncharacterized protein isoform X2 n=1 Tax=Dendropsophus ebraccatus TaxID=150705 RepID=UPI00383222F4